MDETKIIIKELDEDSESSKDAEQKEMLWESRSEIYLKNIMAECKRKSAEHTNLFKVYKRRFKVITVPTIMLPLSSLDDLIKDYKYISIVGLLLISLCSRLNGFLNYGGKSVLHNQASDKYDELNLLLESELSKKKAFRIPVDIMIERSNLNFIHLGASSPPI